MDQVFILRFWREDPGTGDVASWRVLIRNINARRIDVVDDVQRAFAIVAASLDEDGNSERFDAEQEESSECS